MASRIRLSDLARPLPDVARATAEWQAGDIAGAVEQTLAASARDLHSRAYTLWAWSGSTRDGTPGLVTPVRTLDAEAFGRKGPARALARTVTALVWSGADPRRLGLFDWRGFAGIADLDLDLELAAEALAEVHLAPARASAAPLPIAVSPAGDRRELAPISSAAVDLPVARLAREAGVHPLRAAAAFADLGIPEDEVDGYGPELLAALLGSEPVAPEPAPEPPPSMRIDDDPCPRRRHARRVLRRLLGMKKVGVGHHTAFDHIYRGAPADARREASLVGEALVRAGLLGEKPSVGQRHVYLRREALPSIHALIERGETHDPELAELWSEPAPRLAVAGGRSRVRLKVPPPSQ